MSAETLERLSFGADHADGRTSFRLWAPQMESVALDVEGWASQPMRRVEGGWFEAERACPPGARYRFRLPDGMTVPDPASRAQADDIHGWSIVADAHSYDWRTRWKGRPWEETVIYELHAGLMGGFNGVAERLPELADLGVTAIELMPIADFPGRRNWGYDGVLHYAPESSYGTPDELKALIDRAHGLGLMVFLDVVYNHFGPEGNYLPIYASDFFRDDIRTPWGPAIDFRRREVREFFIQNALYWLNEFRFDGLRFDAVQAISEKEGFLHELSSRIREETSPGRHVHLILENDDNDPDLLVSSFDAQWNDDVHHALHVLLTGETESYYKDYAVEPAAKLARGLSEGFIFQGEPASARGGGVRGAPSAHLPPTAFIDFLQNHDQIGNRALGERLSLLADPEALRAAKTVLLLSPHIPMLFMGEENGSRTPFQYFTSHTDDALADLVREGRRREFSGFAAFSDPAARERIPDPNSPATFERSRPEGGPAEEFAFTRALLQTRARLIPLFCDARAERADVLGPHAVAVRWRAADGGVVAIHANLGDAEVSLEPVSGEVLAATPEGAAERLSRGTLMPRSAVVTLLPA